MHTFCHSRRGTFLLLPIALCIAPAWACGSSASGGGPLSSTAQSAAARVDAHSVWQIQLPSSPIMQFSSFSLVHGRIYGLGSDGAVVALRADNGEVSWIHKLAEEFDTIHEPMIYHSQSEDMAVFGLLDSVLLLDPKIGTRLMEMKAPKPIMAPVCMAANRVFLILPGGHMAACRLKDGYVLWRVSFDGVMSVPPVYVQEADAVIAVDEVGLVAGVQNADRTEHRVLFKQNLRSKPSGEPTVEGNMIYLSTENQTLHAIDVYPANPDVRPGLIAWQYRLAKSPVGSPILTKSAIYQATIDGGLQRLAKVPGDFKGWFAPEARQFLAEWPQGVLVVQTDGSLGLLDKDSGKRLAAMDPGPFDQAISNPLNDAVYLTTRRGLVRCLQPAGARPLEMTDFTSATPVLANREERETAIDKLRGQAEAKRLKRDQTAKAELPEPVAAPKTQPAEAVAAPPRDPLKSRVPVAQ